MYAIENGIYNFINSPKEAVIAYLRINENEYNVLLNCIEDKLYFGYTLENLGIHERWEREAKEAIKILEGLIGNEFVDNSVRYQYTPLTSEQNAAIRVKIDAGFYSRDANNVKKIPLKLNNCITGMKIFQQFVSDLIVESIDLEPELMKIANDNFKKLLW